MNIGSIPALGSGSFGDFAAGATRPSTGAGSSSFADMISKVITESQTQQERMNSDINGLITGETDSVHQVVLNVAEADLMFRMLMEVRDRLISSYQEVMRMQI
jgi:flagellar hook-basal body complex protein FliE